MVAVAMNHFTVIAKNLSETKEFYCQFLDLKVGYRPDLGFPGVWLYANEKPVLHIVAGRELPEEPSGVLDHMAFTGKDINKILLKFKANNIDYSLKKQSETNIWQLFFHDPNGAKVELDFPASEKPDLVPANIDDI
tara:strand:+ start:93 stop:500 length:408 start_codon:yes stop_codon:yes gene_type:complete